MLLATVDEVSLLSLLHLLWSAIVQVFGRRYHKTLTRSGGRRPKSAKARNRGGRWCDSSAARYGDLAVWREC
jgi:hypothetical protein